ncbi:MAG TPA: tetratricopeptide repeat protein [Chthoniobacterales bacterium]|nr:tetratricopeptide repeat protein [Chthoniobacterales bacterium]
MTSDNPTPQSRSTPPPRLVPGWVQAQWFGCLVLAFIGFIVRLPALQGEPVWDDDYLVRSNPLIKSPILILETFRHYLFQDTFSAHYRPVQNISYALDYLIWNNNFYGYHLTSLLCHVIGGVLLYLLLPHLFRCLQPTPAIESQASPNRSNHPRLTAFFIAALWMVHPVHSPAIDYVSGRADSLSFLFACTGWLLFLKGRSFTKPGARAAMFAVAWFCALLAICSRESGLIWVAIFCTFTFVFDQNIARRLKWGVLSGCLSLLGAYWVLRMLPGPPSLPQDPSDVTPPLFRVVLMLRALADYARLLVFPKNLHMERTVYNPKAYQSEAGRWTAIEHEYLSIAGLVIIGTLIFLSLRRGPGQRLRLLGTAWFAIAFLPISNLINLNATVAEHWLYLPSVGLLIFLTGCAVELPVRFHRAAAAIGCIAIFALGARSVYRSSDWVSNETFAQRTLQAGGTTLRIVLLLAQAQVARGDYPSAERLLRRAVDLAPDYPMARNNLADALARQGKTKEAEALFARSTTAAVVDRKGYPRTWIAALNLSQIRHKDGDDDAGAIAVLARARREYPNVWDLISAESELLRETGKTEAALDLVEKFARENWWHYRAWGAYGRLLAQQGDVERATAALSHASWLDIHETAALNLIAVIRMRENKLTDAWKTQRRAVSRQPDEPRQYLLLSNILDQMGRTDEARAALAEVSRLKALADSKTAQN